MKKILLLCVLCLIFGCASQQPTFYQLVTTSEPEVTYPQFKQTVLVRSVVLPGETSRPQITTVGGNDYELNIDEFNRWGAEPNKMIQRIIAQDLQLHLPKAIIELQSALRKNYDYDVSVEINEFSGKLGDNAKLSASYFIKNPQGKVIKSGRIQETVAIEDGYGNYVLAQSRLLGALSIQIADDLTSL